MLSVFSQEKENILNKLLKSYGDILCEPELMQKLQEHLTKLEERVDGAIEENPYIVYQDRIKFWRFFYQSKLKRLNKALIKDYREFCAFSDIPFNEKFWLNALNQENANDDEDAIYANMLLEQWQKELEKQKAKKLKKNKKQKADKQKQENTQEQTDEKEKNNNYEIYAGLLLEQWQDEVERLKGEWNAKTSADFGKDFLKIARKWLQGIRRLRKQLSFLGMEFGFWFDDSAGSLTQKDTKLMMQYLEYLENDEGVKKIAELLGQMQEVEQSQEIQSVEEIQTDTKPIKDENSKEEIIGVRLGSEIEYVLPSELALICDETASVLFDLKYLEKKLMCFKLEGIEYQSCENKKQVQKECEIQYKLGSMILCVDTSGSMSGTPENIAKAVALILAQTANKQDRKCFLINFSTKITTIELSGKMELARLINFLKLSFNDVTDATPALRYALEMLKTKNYEKADVLMISDFVMGNLPLDLLYKIQMQRKLKTKFNSLVIGYGYTAGTMKTLFDNEWIYNQNSNSIQELVQAKNAFAEGLNKI
ncbi:MAG: VWA domain-containing protein [Campylobacter sp.]|nr:VWA domain-containing protein [Campylobacter sp.]